MSADVTAFMSLPNFQRLLWGQGLDEGMSLPHINQVSHGKLEQGQSYSRCTSLTLLHRAHTPSCGSLVLLQHT